METNTGVSSELSPLRARPPAENNAQVQSGETFLFSGGVGAFLRCRNRYSGFQGVIRMGFKPFLLFISMNGNERSHRYI